MGYDIWTRALKAIIPNDNLDRAFEELRDFWSEGSVEVPDSLDGLLEGMGFEGESRPDGYILTGYSGSYYFMDEILAILAKHLQDGSWIVWEGDEGEIWCTYTRDGQIHSFDAMITFPGLDEVRL